MKPILYAFFLFNSVYGCQEQEARNKITEKDLDNQLAAIHSFIDAGSCSQDSQCSYIAYGSKSCGGPEGYLVFSTNIEVKTLKAMVAKYTEDEKAYNKQNGIISDCMVPAPPKVLACKDVNCVQME